MNWLWLTAVILVFAIPAAVAWTQRANEDWRPVLPGIVGTGAAFAVSLAAYRWLFTTGTSCSGRGDVGCMLNENQGVLTTLAVGLTAAGLWAAALYRLSDRREARRQLSKRAHEAMTAALDEAAHNLIHVALCYKDGKLGRLPQLTDDELVRLLEPEIRGVVGHQVVRRAQAVRRNLDQIHRAGAHLDEVRRPMRGFVNNYLRVILFLAQTHRLAAEPVIQRPGFQDIRQLVSSKRLIFVCHLSSEAADEAPRMRNEDIPVLCWVNDDPPDGLQVFPQQPRFRDMNHPPHD